LIKKSDKKFEWTEEADQEFSHLKKVLIFMNPTKVDLLKKDFQLFSYAFTSEKPH
jgi:GTPase SAR1 family protein